MVVLKCNVLDNTGTITPLFQSHKGLAPSSFGHLVTLSVFLIDTLSVCTFSYTSQVTPALVVLPFPYPKPCVLCICIVKYICVFECTKFLTNGWYQVLIKICSLQIAMVFCFCINFLFYTCYLYVNFRRKVK